ncbi:MAG TPA: RIO1 family regulatory kinase/ATPase [Anaerolineae bacterium]
MVDDETYEALFETRAEHRQRMRRNTKSKRRQTDPVVEIAERPDDANVGFHPTYKASHHDHGEMQWILAALSDFYADKLIDDVLRAVRGGKEASVYACAAHPSTGVEWLAAKVYRPRMFRSLKNDAVYRQGRGLLDDSGKTIKARDQRVARAVHNGTRFGQELRIGSWIGHEYETLRMLCDAGADLPRPYACGNNAIIMEYLGDAVNAAPTLNQVALEPAEARTLFDQVMHNVALMLSHHRIHADLSAYNVLYWGGAIKIIDFPQAVDPRANPQARSLLARDVERVCQYFNRYGVRADPVALTRSLWARYMRGAEVGT